MSLINDALKQASRAQKQRPSEPPPLGQALRPVDTLNQRRPVDALGPWLIIVVLVLVLGGMMLVGSWWWDRSHAKGSPVGAVVSPPVVPVARNPQPKLVPPAPTQAPPVPVPPPASVANTPAVIPPAISAKPEPVRSNPPAPVAKVIPPPIRSPVVDSQPKPEPVVLHLQGIFYRPSKPSAVINDRTMYVGDTIGEAKVIAIESALVKVEVRGEVISLRMK